MKKLLKLTLFLILTFMATGLFAQSGARLMFSGVSLNKSYLEAPGYFTGYEIKLDGRLGSRVWYFAPGLAYQNTNVISFDNLNPFNSNPRIHTLKIPMALGMKVKTTPNQRVFAHAGLVGNYVLMFDENDSYDFNQINDVTGSAFVNIGYDIGLFTIDYRYEQSLMDNFSHVQESKTVIHSIGLGINF